MEWQEILGYTASVIIAVSLMMNSILQLRWINMIGAALFSAYGFIIGAIPVGILNGFIALINIFYLIKMYLASDFFQILPIAPKSNYLNEYFKFYKSEIHKFFPKFDFNYDSEKHTFSYFIMRNMALAGIVLGYRGDEDTLVIELDFVNPEFRDLKPGKFLYRHNKELFEAEKFKRLLCYPSSYKHEKYLKKIGFIKHNEAYELKLS